MPKIPPAPGRGNPAQNGWIAAFALRRARDDKLKLNEF
jgi:hypothetical protein